MRDGTDTRVERTRVVGDVVHDEPKPAEEKPKRRHIGTLEWLAFLGRITPLLALLIAAPAAAQSDVDRLLRTAWSECGASCSDDEIAALHLVITSTAEREGVRYRTAWRLLSRRLAAGSVSRSWLADLDHRCNEPAGWPTHVYEREGDVLRLVPHAPWSAYRERCEALVERVRLVFDGAIAHRCASTPRSWGSLADAGRSIPGLRWVAVDCGETANTYGEWLAVDPE